MMPLKTNFILLSVVITVAGFGCKKMSTNQLPPQQNEKVTVSTFAGDGTGAHEDGPALLAKFHTPVDVAVGADGIIYVAGGFSNTGAVATVEAYNPATDAWSTVTPLPFRVWGASAAAINGTMYVIGGFDVNNATIGSVEVFTPPTSITAINMYAGLTLTGMVGTTNRIDFKNDIAASNWTVLTNLVLPSSPYLFIDANSPNSTKGFYRVVQQ